MMILSPENGTLYYTTDKNFAISESYKPDSKVLFIDDIESEFYQNYNNPNMVNAALFLPPYSAMCAYQEGDDKKFIMLYEQHITNVCLKVISAIIRALCAGTHIMLYIPDHIISQVECFLSYLNNYHGILTGNNRTIYMYNKAMHDNNIRFMYFMGHITTEEVICNIDLNCLTVDPELKDKLYAAINPVLPSNTFENFMKFLISYKDMMIKYDKPLRLMVANNSYNMEELS